MCGIVVTSDGASGEAARMVATMAHRGPDHVGVHPHPSGRATLGHSRLAIVDVSGGHQPLVSGHGPAAVSNGEIYNHERLREDIPDEALLNDSDAAVLLPLFEAHGPSLVDDLDGMFAFVVVDGDGEVVAARDRLGIKPLYRAHRGGHTAYCSEMKPLIAAGWEDISTVPPGHVWVGDELRRYYSVPEPVLSGTDDDDAVVRLAEDLRAALEQAVVKRLMSDVPLGTFLSGGLDSSIVTALAARHRPGLPTFALGFEGSADLDAARRVADHLGTDHHEIVVTEQEAVDALPDALYHLESWDRDLVRSALPTYLVARFAAESVKVVLTGEGADELFAGYGYHRAYADDPAALQAELHRSVTAMHDSNLQRVDRMTMAHSLEARVPFLDPAVVEVAMRIPGELKLRPDTDGTVVDKWLLRHAFVDLLPPEIGARAKAQFDEGSGMASRLPELADAAVVERGGFAGAPVRDVEEAWYFEQLRARLGDWRAVEANTSTWTENRIEVPTAA